MRQKGNAMTTTFNTFAKAVISEMKKHLEGYEITEMSITKQNDIALHGVTVRRNGSEYAPTMYLDASYEDYCNGHSLDSIVSNLVDIVVLSEPTAPIKSATEMDFSFDAIKDKLTIRLIDTELNKVYLQSHPYGLVGAGLAIVAEINISEGYRCVITNQIAEQFNLNMSEVFETARENMERKYPAKMISMQSALFGDGNDNLLTDSGEIDTMNTLMSENSEGFGAVAIIYKGVAEKIRYILGDYYILPSSLHELIILRDCGDYNATDLKDMVTSANRTVVDACDILSNSVFYYSEAGLQRVS